MDASEAAAFVVPRQDRDADESASGAAPSVAVACPSLEAAGALIRRQGIKAEVVKSEIRDDEGDNIAEPWKKLDPDDARSESQSLRKCEVPMAEGVHLEVIKEIRTACINKSCTGCTKVRYARQQKTRHKNEAARGPSGKRSAKKTRHEYQAARGPSAQTMALVRRQDLLLDAPKTG